MGVDVLFGVVVNRPLQMQPFPQRHVELRPHFDIELKNQRPVVGNLDRPEIEVRLTDGGKFVLFADLRQAVHQQLAFDLFVDGVLELPFHELAGGSARAKARQLGLGCDLVELLLDVPLHVLAADGHGHVPLAGGGLGDFHLQPQLGLCGLLLLGRRFGFGLGLAVDFRLRTIISFGGGHGNERSKGLEKIDWGQRGATLAPPRRNDSQHAPLKQQTQSWARSPRRTSGSLGRRSAVIEQGAGDEIRTHDNHVGNVVLYQLSYTRLNLVPEAAL